MILDLDFRRILDGICCEKSTQSICQKGFTLLEVLITITLLASLMVFTTRSIQHGIKTKSKLQKQMEDMSQVRDALKIMEKDINLAFHYRDIEKEIKEEVKKKTTQTSAGGGGPGGLGGTGGPGNQGGLGGPGGLGGSGMPTPLPPNPLLQNRMDPTTQFEGTDTEVSFATMNVSPISEGDIQADFGAVGYRLIQCKPPSEAQTSSCLARRFSPLVEGDITKGGEETVLLTHVDSLNFRYIGKGKQDWVTQWSSKTNSDSVTLGRYPDAVEISITVKPVSSLSIGSGLTDQKDEKNKIVKMNIVARVHFANNEEKR